jgi:pimeloyl-ACP methyl ester carboxylesterase
MRMAQRFLPRTAIRANGLTFQVVDQGEGPAVLLLHGFPDSADVWRHQVPALVEAGFRVIAPDQRGMGDSDAPAERDAYTNQQFFADLTGILEVLGLETVDVVGHDIGAGFAWGMAALMPQRVRRLAVLSVGHPAGYWAEGMPQREASWYMWFFRFDAFAETMLQRDGWKLFRELAGDAVDVDRYVDDLSRPGRLEAALNWYRARQSLEFLIDGAVSIPAVTCSTLGIWSSGDRFCREQQMVGSARRVDGPWRYVHIEGAGHWMTLDAPDRVNQLLAEFLSAKE